MTTVRRHRGRDGPSHDLVGQALWHSTIIVPACDAGRSPATHPPLQAIRCTRLRRRIRQRGVGSRFARGNRARPRGTKRGRPAGLRPGFRIPEVPPKVAFRGEIASIYTGVEGYLAVASGSVTRLIPVSAVATPSLRIFLSFRNPPAVSGVELPNVGWARCRVRGTGQPAAPSNDEQGQAAEQAANAVQAWNTMPAPSTAARGRQAGGRAGLRVRPGRAGSRPGRRAEARPR